MDGNTVMKGVSMSIMDQISALKNNKAVLYLCVCSTIWILFLVIVFQKGYTIIAYNTPKEIREMSSVVFAYRFAQGDNLYAASAMNQTMPPAICVYGILVPLILAPLIRIFSFTFLNPLQICELATLLFEVVGAIFFYRLLYKKTSHGLLAVVGMFFFYCCYFRVDGFGGAFPDQWGLTMSVILMYVVYLDEMRGCYHPGIYAAIIIGLFYTKQYFVFVVVGLCLYMFMHSKKAFGLLALYGVGGGIISILCVDYFFPLYFSEALAIMQEQVGPVGDWRFSIGQVWELNKVYIGIIVFGVIHAFLLIYHVVKKKELKGEISYEFCQIVCMFPIVLYLAMNPGNYYAYWFQMWYPYVIAWCIVSMVMVLRRLLSLRYAKVRALCLGMCCILMGVSFYQMLCAPPYFFRCGIMTDEARDAWSRSYSILEKYAKKGDILVPMLLSNYCLENDIETLDYGHAQCMVPFTLENYKNSKLWTNFSLVDYTEDLLDKYIQYNDVEIRDHITNQSYSCIALTSVKDYGLSEQELIDSGYHLLTKENLPSGRQQWEVTFYVKN